MLFVCEVSWAGSGAHRGPRDLCIPEEKFFSLNLRFVHRLYFDFLLNRMQSIIIIKDWLVAECLTSLH